MREYRFRGKRVADGQWTHGRGLIVEDNGTAWISRYYHRGEWEQVDPETVGQLLHKIGDTEVYDDDILLIEIHDHWTKKVIVSALEKVEVRDCKIGVEWGISRWFSSLAEFSNTTMTLVGNIHDNPEMMGGGEDD